MSLAMAKKGSASSSEEEARKSRSSSSEDEEKKKKSKHSKKRDASPSKKKKSKKEEKKKKSSKSSEKKKTPIKKKLSDEELLRDFPKKGLGKEPKGAQRLYVSRVLHDAERACTASEYSEMQVRSGAPESDQVCYVELALNESDKRASSLAVKLEDSPDLYFPIRWTAEKRAFPVLFGEDFIKGKFTDKVQAYHNRLPMALGLEKFVDVFGDIPFISDRYFHTELKLDKPTVKSLDKMKFGETQPYVPVCMQQLTGTLAYSLGGGGAGVDHEDSEEEPDKKAAKKKKAEPKKKPKKKESSSSSSSEEKKKKNKKKKPAKKSSSSDESGEVASESEEKKTKKKATPNGKKAEVAEPVYVNNDEMTEAGLTANSSTPLANLASDPRKIAELIQASSKNYVLGLDGHGGLTGAIPISQVVNRSNILDTKKAPAPEKEPVKLLQQQGEAPLAPKKKAPMPAEKRKLESQPSEQPSKKVNSSQENGDSRVPSYVNMWIANAVREKLTGKPDAKFNLREELDQFLGLKFSFVQLHRERADLEARFPLLYPTLQAWFEFYCSDNKIAIQSKHIDDLIGTWIRQLEKVKLLDRTIQVVDTPMSKQEAKEMDLYELVKHAAHNQFQWSHMLSDVFVPTDKVMKMFPEDENAYKNSLKTDVAFVSHLYSSLLDYELAKAAGSAISRKASVPEPPAAEPESDDLF